MLLQRFIVPVDKTRRDKAHTISGGASIIVDICSNWKGMMILQRCVNTATLRVRRKHATVPLCAGSCMCCLTVSCHLLIYCLVGW